jgi:transposase
MATDRSRLGSVTEATVYVAFELSKRSWKLALTCGFGVPPILRTVASGDLAGVQRVVTEAQRHWGLASATRVVSCYEAGRDGFWIHRALATLGVANRVVDSSSIEVTRRARRTKTDRLDAIKLVLMLVRACQGDPRVWQEVRVPSVAAEAARHISRERTGLTQERTRLGNQMQSWLATWGCRVSRRRWGRAGWWTEASDWAGQALPVEVQARIARAHARLAVITEQIAALETAQRTAATTAVPDSALGRLVRLKGVAPTSASVLLDEGLLWRAFRNRREIGGLLGFAPTRSASGETTRDQGIRRAGNRRLQTISVQLAWNWIRWQPSSALTQWYLTHWSGGRRARLSGIVAVARKLLIALWRYASSGVVPTGAVLKAA